MTETAAATGKGNAVDKEEEKDKKKWTEWFLYSIPKDQQYSPLLPS